MRCLEHNGSLIGYKFLETIFSKVHNLASSCTGLTSCCGVKYLTSRVTTNGYIVNDNHVGTTSFLATIHSRSKGYVNDSGEDYFSSKTGKA